MLPSLPVPGVRIGLANVAIVIALVTLGGRWCITISLMRVVVVGLATGTLLGPVGMLSAAGGAAAAGAMFLLARSRAFSVLGVSLGGSAAHVSAQLVVAVLLSGSTAPLLLLPLSLALSLPSGLVIGYSARLLLSRLPSRSLSAV